MNLEVLGWIALITFIAGFAGTGIGGLIGIILKKDSSKIVSLLRLLLVYTISQKVWRFLFL